MNYKAKAIRDKWEATTALNNALDVSKVFLGLYVTDPESYPFATITFPGGVLDVRTNAPGARIDLETVRIALYGTAEGYSDLTDLATLVRSTYLSWDTEMDDGCFITDTQIDPPQEIQDQDDGNWAIIIDLEMQVS